MEFCTILSSAHTLRKRPEVGKNKFEIEEMDLRTCAVQQSSESPLGNVETEPVSFPAFQGALFVFLLDKMDPLKFLQIKTSPLPLPAGSSPCLWNSWLSAASSTLQKLRVGKYFPF